MKRPFGAWASFGIVLLAAAGSAKAQYIFTSIDYPGATSTAVNNIDNAGRIVGEYDGGGGHHAFIWENGAFTSFDVPSASSSSANGINASNQVVGYYVSGNTTAYIRNGTTYTDLTPFSGTPEARAYSVNDAGRIAGYYSLPSTGNYRGFFYNGTTYTTLNYPGAVGSQAIGINNSDQIVGYYFNGKPHGFLYTGGGYTTVDHPLPGSLGTVAQGINDSGHIAGIYFDASDKDHGFVKTASGYSTVDYPGPILFSGLVGINNAGQVAGYYRDASGFHGYLATPIAAADFDSDGQVNGVDLTAWTGSFGVSVGATKSMGDANGDFAVNGTDFLKWQSQLTIAGAAVPAQAPVPEPAALSLAVLSVVGLGALAGRHRD